MREGVVYDTLENVYTFSNETTYESMFFLIIVIGAIFIGRDRFAKRDYSGLLGSVLAVLGFSLFILFLTSINLKQYDEYQKLVQRIETKNYQIVQGRVTNFSPIDIYAKKEEEFTVSNVTFKYSAHMEARVFHSVKGHYGKGNPIEEGLMVKIMYFYDKDAERNFILKLEILKP